MYYSPADADSLNGSPHLQKPPLKLEEPSVRRMRLWGVGFLMVLLKGLTDGYVLLILGCTGC